MAASSGRSARMRRRRGGIAGVASPRDRAMEFRILGPFEVHAGNGPVTVPGGKLRATLAVLVLHANEAVSAERMAVALWGEDAPAGAVKNVQVYVSRLRRALGDPDVLSTTPAGYRLRIAPGDLDADRFEQLAEEGRRALAAGEPERAADVLRDALSLWRGEPLAEFAFSAFAQAAIARLDEQRLAAIEMRVDADLALGRHVELVAELQDLIARAPAERAAARPADARALSLRAPGRRARGVPSGAPGARRRDRRRARTRPAAPARGRSGPRSCARAGAGHGSAARGARGRARSRRSSAARPTRPGSASYGRRRGAAASGRPRR